MQQEQYYNGSQGYNQQPPQQQSGIPGWAKVLLGVVVLMVILYIAYWPSVKPRRVKLKTSGKTVTLVPVSMISSFYSKPTLEEKNSLVLVDGTTVLFSGTLSLVDIDDLAKKAYIETDEPPKPDPAPSVPGVSVTLVPVPAPEAPLVKVLAPEAPLVKVSVPAPASKNWRYKGCYKDNETRVINTYKGVTTFDECKAFAVNGGLNTFAMQYHEGYPGGQKSDCWIANDPAYDSLGTMNNCTFVDNGGMTHGNANSNAVYRLE